MCARAKQLYAGEHVCRSIGGVRLGQDHSQTARHLSHYPNKNPHVYRRPHSARSVLAANSTGSLAATFLGRLRGLAAQARHLARSDPTADAVAATIPSFHLAYRAELQMSSRRMCCPPPGPLHHRRAVASPESKLVRAALFGSGLLRQDRSGGRRPRLWVRASQDHG